jgi:hypothetical protein
MKDTDNVAVYDKKSLWRSNLYVDEGAVDWNNLHPWKAPLSENDWNKNEDGSLFTGEKAGKQVVTIKPWTRYYQGDGTNFDNPERDVAGHVAYTTGRSDSPFKFNRELTE